MKTPLDASDAASLVQADWHEEYGDSRIADEIRESVMEINANNKSIGMPRHVPMRQDLFLLLVRGDATDFLDRPGTGGGFLQGVGLASLVSGVGSSASENVGGPGFERVIGVGGGGL